MPSLNQRDSKNAINAINGNGNAAGMKQQIDPNGLNRNFNMSLLTEDRLNQIMLGGQVNKDNDDHQNSSF